MREFNPQLWFGKRKLDFVPKHFVRAITPATQQSIDWVENRLIGRYSLILESNDVHGFVFTTIERIYFEDPKELTLYELCWSGN